MIILYFGPARECAGISSETIDSDRPITLDTFWEGAIARHPGLARCREISRVAVGMEYLGAGEMIPADAEVAIIPPVAGG